LADEQCFGWHPARVVGSREYTFDITRLWASEVRAGNVGSSAAGRRPADVGEL
jgi:hypothetical protein